MADTAARFGQAKRRLVGFAPSEHTVHAVAISDSGLWVTACTLDRIIPWDGLGVLQPADLCYHDLERACRHQICGPALAEMGPPAACWRCGQPWGDEFYTERACSCCYATLSCRCSGREEPL